MNDKTPIYIFNHLLGHCVSPKTSLFLPHRSALILQGIQVEKHTFYTRGKMWLSLPWTLSTCFLFTVNGN